MSRYFVDGVETTEAAAKEMAMKNAEYLVSGTTEDLLKVKFVVTV